MREGKQIINSTIDTPKRASSSSFFSSQKGPPGKSESGIITTKADVSWCCRYPSQNIPPSGITIVTHAHKTGGDTPGATQKIY